MTLQENPIRLSRKPVDFQADITRVILKPFIPRSRRRVQKILQRVLKLPEETVGKLLEQVTGEFADRHNEFFNILEDNYRRIAHFIPGDQALSAQRKALIGAYFTHEYSVEAAALFNPSIVLHPDQRGLQAGSSRFILSLRATGEGHISSIEFRTGVLHRDNQVEMEETRPFLVMPEALPIHRFEKSFLKWVLHSAKIDPERTQKIEQELPDEVEKEQLTRLLNQAITAEDGSTNELKKLDSLLRWLQAESFDLKFNENYPLSERIIFPTSAQERQGIEDARFVRFVDEQGEAIYYASYTGYDGKSIHMKLIETRDFVHFRVRPFIGPAVQNKGLALFPEKLNGQYAAIARQDGESLYLMYSDSIYHWESAKILQAPERPWEVVQIGNCGSPIKTDAGWLLLTHGVGPLRKYVIGVYLLDLHDPSKIIGAPEEPILTPNKQEREGYVPNVVYSCGGMIHQNELVLPYAYADRGAGIATLPLDQLLNSLLKA